MTLQLFRRHVAVGSHDCAGLRPVGFEGGGVGLVLDGLLHAGKTKIEDLHPPVGSQKDVLRFEVSVDDPLLVDRCQPLGHSSTDFSRALPAESVRRNPLPQGLSFEQFGDRVGDALVTTKIPDLEDIRVGELGHRSGLAFETFETVGVVRHGLRQHLDRHVTVEALIVCAIDLTHPAGADFFDDAVVIEGVTDEVSQSICSCCSLS